MANSDPKFGWSLPPGCNSLPGESEAEQAQEALIEAIYEALAPFRKFYDSEGGEGDEIEDKAVASIEALMSEVYSRGQSDAAVVNIQPFNEDDMQRFLHEHKLEGDYLQWLSTQPMRS